MKRKLLGIFLLIALSWTIIQVINFFNPSLPAKVTSDNILKVTPGMTLEQVCEILGRPLTVEALNGIHKIGCSKMNPTLDTTINSKTDIRQLVFDFIEKQKYCCEGNKEDVEQFNCITLVYTKSGFLASYPMLWVHLDRSFKVNNIYAKEYGSFLGDDPGIYGFGWAMDSTYTKVDYSKTDKWVNEKKFFRCFK